MFRRSQWFLLMLVVAVMAALPVGALAQAPDGRIHALGNGRVVAEGRVVIIGQSTVRGGVNIRVIDRAGDAKVSVNGRDVRSRVVRRQREYRVRQTGMFLISGSSVSVKLRSSRMNLSIAGVGRVRLAGRGSATVNGRTRVSWNNRIIRLSGATTRTTRTPLRERTIVDPRR